MSDEEDKVDIEDYLYGYGPGMVLSSIPTILIGLALFPPIWATALVLVLVNISAYTILRKSKYGIHTYTFDSPPIYYVTCFGKDIKSFDTIHAARIYKDVIDKSDRWFRKAK